LRFVQVHGRSGSGGEPDSGMISSGIW
jgi:hypothetical protein